MGSNPAQRSAEKTAREEVIKNREAITNCALVIVIRVIKMVLMMIMTNCEAMIMMIMMITENE